MVWYVLLGYNVELADEISVEKPETPSCVREDNALLFHSIITKRFSRKSLLRPVLTPPSADDGPSTRNNLRHRRPELSPRSLQCNLLLPIPNLPSLLPTLFTSFRPSPAGDLVASPPHTPARPPAPSSLAVRNPMHTCRTLHAATAAHNLIIAFSFPSISMRCYWQREKSLLPHS